MISASPASDAAAAWLHLGAPGVRRLCALAGLRASCKSCQHHHPDQEASVCQASARWGCSVPGSSCSQSGEHPASSGAGAAAAAAGAGAGVGGVGLVRLICEWSGGAWSMVNCNNIYSRSCGSRPGSNPAAAQGNSPHLPIPQFYTEQSSVLH
jgi:hypothetical protein